MSDEPQTVDKAAHDALVRNHEALKRDAQADRDALKAMQTQLAELTAAKEEAEAEKAKASGDIEQVKANLEAKHSRELQKLTDRAEKAEGQVRKLVVDNGLDAALDAANVSPALKKAAKALLREGVELKEENGEPVALLQNAPLADAIKTWAGTDEGKHFVTSGNSGGGAPGGGGAPTGSNPWKAGSENLTEQERIQAKDPALAGRLKAEAGVA